jgi:hypothetical protein
MFVPNLKCTIQTSSGNNDVYGQPIPGALFNERCSIVKMMIDNNKSSVRGDSSASRGSALELETVSVILLVSNTVANIDDIVTVSGYSLRVRGKAPQYDVMGNLDHWQVDLTMWSVA